jgi:NagD protein
MFFIDVQGTLIKDSDKTPIEGSLEFIKTLNQKQIPYLLITNNTKQSSKDFFNFLVGSGFEIQEHNYIDPLMVLKSSIQEKNIAAYGSDEFLKNLKNLGYNLDFNSPQAVLVAIKKDFSNEEYADMIEFVLNGAKLIGMHETSIYAKEKRYPGVVKIPKM